MIALENLIQTTLNASPILIFAGLAAMISFRVGILNIGLEGIMLIAAYVAVAVNIYSGSPTVGLLVATVVATAFGFMFAIFNLKFKVNNIIVSVGINLLGAAGTRFAMNEMFGTAGAVASTEITRMQSLSLPFLEKIPILRVFDGESILLWVAFISVVVIQYIMTRTPAGIRITATGYNSSAVDTAGVDSRKIKYICLTLSGTLCGLAGAYMSTYYVTMFVRDMIGGRGYLGNIASVIGARSAVGTFLASMMFSISDALVLKLQTQGVSSYLLDLVPYVIALGTVVIISVRKKAKNKKKNVLQKAS